MQNDRPIQDRNLREGLREVHKVLRRRGLAGAVMLVAEDETAYTYAMHAPWSAIQPDEASPLGFRIRAKSAEDGRERTRARVLAAVHTICQIADFGEQTVGWMEDLKLALRRAGIDFEHRPFGGKPLPRLDAAPGPQA